MTDLAQAISAMVRVASRLGEQQRQRLVINGSRPHPAASSARADLIEPDVANAESQNGPATVSSCDGMANQINSALLGAGHFLPWLTEYGLEKP